MTEHAGARFGRRALVGWLVGSTIVFVLAGIVSLFLTVGLEETLLEPMGLETGAGSLAHGIALAAHVAVWGLLAAGVMVASCKIVLPQSRPFGPRSSFVFGLGVILAAAVQLALYEWARDRFVYFDPDMTGITTFLPGVILAQSCLWVTTLVMPRAWRRLPAVGLGVTSLAILLVVAVNVPGAGDGIRPASVPLAVAIAASSAYVLLTWAMLLDARNDAR